MWRTINEEKVADVREFVRRAAEGGGRKVAIGTDSLQTRRLTQFVTVVAILNPGKGGRALYRREVVPRIASLRQRLLKEVWLSVELGLELDAVLPETTDLTIHIDANPVVTHRSSRYVKELVAMAVSQGFRAVIKPESWAASHAADRVVRGIVKPAQRVS